MPLLITAGANEVVAVVAPTCATEFFGLAELAGDELLNLEDHGGRIDHPYAGDTTSKDCADAMIWTAAWLLDPSRVNLAVLANQQLQGALAGVPVGLPALTRALKLQQKAGKIGFDWNDPLAVLAKIREEADEIEAAIKLGQSKEAAAEVGDLLFAVVNLGRHLNADPEAALRATNQKFTRRFASIERALAGRGRSAAESTLAEMDALWNEAKEAE